MAGKPEQDCTALLAGLHRAPEAQEEGKVGPPHQRGAATRGALPDDAHPPPELNSLMLPMADAEDLAAEGNAADGYTALLSGLRRAEEAEEDGMEWGALSPPDAVRVNA
jgi:hypothetical protein